MRDVTVREKGQRNIPDLVLFPNKKYEIHEILIINKTGLYFPKVYPIFYKAPIEGHFFSS